jgi:rare lipoprotein A
MMKRTPLACLAMPALGLWLGGCVDGPKPETARGPSLGSGIASFYGGGEYLNAHTANGERFNPSAMTAAHRSLPFGAQIRVTNLANQQTCTVRINDRGPAVWTGRVIDLSKGAARQCGFVAQGTARVKLQRIE